MSSPGVDLEQPDPADRANSLLPPAREPGPPRHESAEQLTRARDEAARTVRALAQGGVSPREVCSMADIRGFRLFRRRYFGQARVWFEAAVQLDGSFEPALLNAARAAAAGGDMARARVLLRRLRGIDTPLARSRLRLARRDLDLGPLLRSAGGQPRQAQQK